MASCETVGGVLYLNPGSAGPRRFTLPIALATLELAGDACDRDFTNWADQISGRQRPERRLAGANDREPALIS